MEYDGPSTAVTSQHLPATVICYFTSVTTSLSMRQRTESYHIRDFGQFGFLWHCNIRIFEGISFCRPICRGNRWFPDCFFPFIIRWYGDGFIRWDCYTFRGYRRLHPFRLPLWVGLWWHSAAFLACWRSFGTLVTIILECVCGVVMVIEGCNDYQRNYN